jgi:hypothetical protein
VGRPPGFCSAADAGGAADGIREEVEMCAGQWERLVDCGAEAERLLDRTRKGGNRRAAELGRGCG